MKRFRIISTTLASVAALIGSFAFSSKPLVTKYFYNPVTQQAWNASPLDQTASHYTQVTTLSCATSTSICTYTKDIHGNFVQSTEGTFIGN